MLKNVLKSLLIVLIFVSCGQGNTSVNASQKIVLADTKATLSIEGMSCQKGCADFISKELEKLDGVVKSDISFENKLASVEYNTSQVSEYAMIDLINTIKDSVYRVTNVEVKIIKTIEKGTIQTH